MNEIQLAVLHEQFDELQVELGRLLLSDKAHNGLINGYHTVNGLNGYSTSNIQLSTSQRSKYRIDVSAEESYRTVAVKKQFVSRYPCVLCIHFNRLQFGSKDSRYVSFKPLLSLNQLDERKRRLDYFDTEYDNDYSLCSQYLLMSV